MLISREPWLIHEIPGRVRVHLSGWTPREQYGLSLRLRQAPGVRDVRANTLTGNTLVLFDPNATDAQAIVMAMRAQWLRATLVEDDGRTGVISNGASSRAPTETAALSGVALVSARRGPPSAAALWSQWDGPPVPMAVMDGSGRQDAAPLSSTGRRHRFLDVLRALRRLSGFVGLGVCIVSLVRAGSMFGLIVNGLELFLLCGDVLARRTELRRVTVLSSPGTDRGDGRVVLSLSTHATRFTLML